jgi:membrane-bound ClpP family serine protease
MIRKRNTRRLVGLALVVLGAVLMWAAANPVWGGVVFLAAIVIEIVGIRLEHREGDK